MAIFTNCFVFARHKSVVGEKIANKSPKFFDINILENIRFGMQKVDFSLTAGRYQFGQSILF